MTAAPQRARADRIDIETLAAYADVVDVRTPAEYAEDHIPRAINCPVLSNEERARVGTLHNRVSEFEARKVGAALISRNIAAIVERFHDRPRDWAPAIYCWRGGLRSRALVHVLTEIGWRAVQLDGGYRAYRSHVVEHLGHMPAQRSYRVICGLTGSGKSRLLSALAEAGAQVLDLEGLARHRGSVLGEIPDAAQPSQKHFESLVFDRLRYFDPARPVFVESESRKIGRIEVPPRLLEAMRASPCVRVDLAPALRVALLKEEYAHFLSDRTRLVDRLAPLIPLHGKAKVGRWQALAASGDFDTLVYALLVEHYDPTYARAIERNFPHYARAHIVAPEAIDAEAFARAARSLIV